VKGASIYRRAWTTDFVGSATTAMAATEDTPYIFVATLNNVRLLDSYRH
jgi:hypothetical protein